MTDVVTWSAPQGAIAMSSVFMQRLDSATGPGPIALDSQIILPQTFSALALDDLLSVTHKLGVLATTPASADDAVGPRDRVYRGATVDYSLSIAEMATLMDAAYTLIRDWPLSAFGLFSSIADRNPDPCVEHEVRRMFATRCGYRLLAPQESLDGCEIRAIHQTFENWLFEERGIYLDGRRRPKVGSNGDVAIDIADAMRRLEGRDSYTGGIKQWHDAGAVILLGKKVLLNSVDQTLKQMSKLKCEELSDGVPCEEWATRFTIGYRKADALRDILSGNIRVQRDPRPNRPGLAGLRISAGDLQLRIQKFRAARSDRQKSSVAHGTPLPEQAQPSKLERRVMRALANDRFCQPSVLNALLAEIWHGHISLDFAQCPDVRCRYVVGRYGGRDCPRRVYSVADAIKLVTAHRGAVPL